MTTPPYRRPGAKPRYEVKIVIRSWRHDDQWKTKAEERLADLLNEGWVIVGQSEAPSTEQMTWTLMRMYAS